MSSNGSQRQDIENSFEAVQPHDFERVMHEKRMLIEQESCLIDHEVSKLQTSEF